MIKRRVAKSEVVGILFHCHSSPSGGDFRGSHIAAKDAYAYVKNCNRCQLVGNILIRNEMPLSNIFEENRKGLGALKHSATSSFNRPKKGAIRIEIEVKIKYSIDRQVSVFLRPSVSKASSDPGIVSISITLSAIYFGLNHGLDTRACDWPCGASQCRPRVKHTGVSHTV
ncbi:Transposon Ty3-I Gag-Pol polyprotein [Gossypium australe]|uniref:Transposon Ty3-I Gag-Pol polyprotein n=1 Tax=Gossypium australe TaxID=47621 RepID=A0A5B6VKT8_9ROSI|nr:Transposon Ty3-I Gag-Pol polyprotein [Gossypium australe]